MLHRCTYTLGAAALMAFASAPAVMAQTPSFQGLGFLGGDNQSQALGISADGTSIVGLSDDGGSSEAFRWTSSDGLVGLGMLTGGIFSFAYDASGDGSVVVGQSGSSNGLGFEAFRWTSGGMQGLGFIPGSFDSEAYGVSGDGAVVVGESTLIADGTSRAWRWTAGGGMVDLGLLTGTGESRAFAASGDGSVVVGSSGRPFRWTQAGGMAELGCLPGGCAGTAAAVTSDGSVIVGVGVGGGGLNEAFRWTQAGGIAGLGVLAGATASQAFDVSDDGATVVGRSSGRAFVWTPGAGMRDLQAVLVGLGLDLTGWTLSTADGVSADGTVIVGYGSNPSGQMEAWRAVVPIGTANAPSPESTGLVLHAPAPNPAAGSTTLRFDLPTAGRVRLAIHDMLGREVALPVDGERPAGVHEVTLSADALAPGVYLVRVAAASGTAVRHVTVVR
jgi:probable HAF family extracellular repeat protein